ncbi:MAG: hypothetical protein GY936_19070 [Ignavibacteriae bacterium]|nr:hypothetical protein [Ignavibacteriota bacterium]
MKKLLVIIFLITFNLIFFSSCSESNIIEPTNDQSEIVLKQKVGTIGDNLIINSNMEDGQNSFWAGSYANPNFSFSHTDKESNSSSHSLMIEANSGEKDQFAYWAQTIKTSDLVGKKLTASVSIKYNDVDESGVALVIRGDNTETPQGSAEVFGTTQYKVIKTGSGDWQTLEVSINIVPENIKSITVYMLLAAQNGSVYFDDLSLVSDIGQGPTYALKTLILK